MHTLPGSQLYHTRGALALCLAVIQGWKTEDACNQAGTKASNGVSAGDLARFTQGKPVLYRDKNNVIHAGIVESTSGYGVKISLEGRHRPVWVTVNRLEVR